MRSAREMHSNGRRSRRRSQLARVRERPRRDESRTHRPRTRADRAGSGRRWPRLRRRRSPATGGDASSPKTERLHHVQVYGQPRAVISDTGAEAVALAPRRQVARRCRSRRDRETAARSRSAISARGGVRISVAAARRPGTRCREHSPDDPQQSPSVSGRQQFFERLFAFADDHDVGAGVEILGRVVRRIGSADDDARAGGAVRSRSCEARCAWSSG